MPFSRGERSVGSNQMAHDSIYLRRMLMNYDALALDAQKLNWLSLNDNANIDDDFKG